MTANHVLTGLSFGLSVSIASWMVGIIGGALLQKTSYFAKLSHLRLIPHSALRSAPGIEQFKRIVRNSVLRYANQSIRVEGKHTDLVLLRHQMTVAEINHLIGFLFVAAIAVYQSNSVSLIFALSMMIPNTLLNGYPALLQQENKRRIDLLLERQSRRRDDGSG